MAGSSAANGLELQIEGLQASRARIAGAAMAERRRIERELHDGVQQHLVAVIVNLQLARELADGDLEGAKAVLDELSADARVALASVRELGHELYPSVLRDRGPAEAIRAAAVASGARVRVQAAPTRGGEDADAAVYDCCVELIANVAEHAGADARAKVRLWQEDGTLRFEVADDGVGFEPSAARCDGGLARAADVVGALGGSLEVDAAPGRGTRVAGSVPVAP
jgi:signal transduction histidine kinase